LGIIPFNLVTVLLDATLEDRLFGLDIDLINQSILSMISLLVLFIILGYLLFIPVREFMQKRTDKIKEEISQAADTNKEALALKAKYQDKIKTVDKEVEEILSEARRKAKEKEKEIIQEANEEAAKIIARAALDIKREKEQIKDDIRNEIIDVATIMASKFVASTIDSSQKEALIEETLVSMGEDTWLN
jgi:F-type H+-transporting ATPase subunit b